MIKIKILVVLAHPDENSFNHSIAKTAVETLLSNGHEVFFHDLYKEKFDPLLFSHEFPMRASLDKVIAAHCDEISNAEGIIIVHPNWWGQPPAILKGWMDRVIRPGVAYIYKKKNEDEVVSVGLLKAETALVFNTANTPENIELEVFLDPLETLWKNCIFEFCGVKHFYRKMFRILIKSTFEQRQKWLEEVEETVASYFPFQQVN